MALQIQEELYAVEGVWPFSWRGLPRLLQSRSPEWSDEAQSAYVRLPGSSESALLNALGYVAVTFTDMELTIDTAAEEWASTLPPSSAFRLQGGSPEYTSLFLSESDETTPASLSHKHNVDAADTPDAVIPRELERSLMGAVLERAVLSSLETKVWSYVDVDRESGWRQFVIEVVVDASPVDRDALWSELCDVVDDVVESWPASKQHFGGLVGVSVRPMSRINV